MSAEPKSTFLSRCPELGTDPLPVDPYVSRDYFAREIDRIYRRDWLCVGRDEELPAPGDYKVKRLDFARTSVILIRGKDRKVRGFHNVCRHRGNKVVTETGGEETFGSKKAAVLTCRFHGWVYNASGELVDVPREANFPPSFSRADNGLVPIHVDTWSGFIFVNLAERPARALIDYLGGAREHLEGYPFSELSCSYGYYAHINCNWKIGMDAFSEAYHVPTIHAGSFPGIVDYWLDDFELYGDHHSIAFYSSGVNPPTPVGTAANDIFAASLALKRAAEVFPLPPTVNPRRDKNWGFEGTTIFPNYVIHVGEGFWFTHQFWPVTQNECLWEGRYYVKPPATNSQRWAQRYAVTLQRNAWLEDTATMEDTHEALLSGAVSQINLQDDEILLRHNLSVIESRVQGG
jgi:phenylpropionate dioxygenase-like ring-hydroxylating dioxygenase large terminal subunit